MADTVITAFDSACRRAIDDKVVELMHLSELLTRTFNKKKVHGGNGIGWIPQKARRNLQSYTAGSTWTIGTAEQDDFEEARLAWKHFVMTMEFPKTKKAMLVHDKAKAWDLIAAQIKANAESTKYDLAADLFGDGSAVVITKPDASAGTRTPIIGLTGICTPDGEYAGYTPDVATSANMWWQPRALNLLASTSPSQGDSIGFTGTPSWNNLSNPDSPFCITRIADDLILSARKLGRRVTYIAVGTSTLKAWGRYAAAREQIVQPSETATLGFAAFKYAGVEIGYEPALDDLSVERMFAIPESELELHVLTEFDGKFSGWVDPAPGKGDLWTSNNTISCELVARNRASFGMAYNIPRM
jgi:hypothetical protein